MPREGVQILRLEDRTEGLKCILEKEDVSGIDLVQANQLSVEIRLLHHIISRIIFPKTGRFDWVTERDVSLMYFLINGIKVNLPCMMLLQISEVLNKSKGCMPYGMFFTLVFTEFGINLNGEASKKLQHTDYYNSKSLHRMGFVKAAGRWVKKTSGIQIMEEEPQEAPQAPPTIVEEEEPHSPVQPTSTPQQTSQPTTSNLDYSGIESFLLDLKKDIFEKIDQVKEDSHAEIEHLREEIIRSQLEIRTEIKGLSRKINTIERSAELHRETEGELVKAATQLNKKVGDALSVQWHTTGLLQQGIKDLQNQVSKILEKVTTGFAAPSGSAYQSGAGTSRAMVATSEAPTFPKTTPKPEPSTKSEKKPAPPPKQRTKTQVRKKTVHHRPYSSRPSPYRFPKPTKSGVEVISSSSSSSESESE